MWRLWPWQGRAPSSPPLLGRDLFFPPLPPFSPRAHTRKTKAHGRGARQGGSRWHPVRGFFTPVFEGPSLGWKIIASPSFSLSTPTSPPPQPTPQTPHAHIKQYQAPNMDAGRCAKEDELEPGCLALRPREGGSVAASLAQRHLINSSSGAEVPPNQGTAWQGRKVDPTSQTSAGVSVSPTPVLYDYEKGTGGSCGWPRQ